LYFYIVYCVAYFIIFVHYIAYAFLHVHTGKHVVIKRLNPRCASFLHACTSRSKYLVCICRKLTKHMYFVVYLVVGFHSHLPLTSFNINTNIHMKVECMAVSSLCKRGGRLFAKWMFLTMVVVFLTFVTIYFIWNPKPDKDNTCTTIHFHEGDIPLRAACRPISALCTAYRHVLAMRTAYHLTTKQPFFGNFIYKKKIKWQYVACTRTIILANVNFGVFLLDFLVFDILNQCLF